MQWECVVTLQLRPDPPFHPVLGDFHSTPVTPEGMEPLWNYSPFLKLNGLRKRVA
jgi:hypothetical protein